MFRPREVFANRTKLQTFCLLLAIAFFFFCVQPAKPEPSQLAGKSIQQPSRIADSEDDEIGFLCPMHPDYTSETPGKCPRCGMALVRGTLFDMRDYRLEFKTVPAIPRAGEKVILRLKVFHPGTGEPIKNFEVVHEKRFHLFVISQDMAYFEHIHPEESADGTWSIDVKLPKPGYYEVLSDFVPTGGHPQFLKRLLITAGFKGDRLAQRARLVPDKNSQQTVDDLRATVEYDPNRLVAGAYGHLTFHLTKGGTDEPVTDLQTYLGAFGHMLMMSEDMLDYVHAHPAEMFPTDAVRGGPDIMFEGLMPKPGRYRAWTQFRYHDKIHTFVSTFEVFDIGQQGVR